MQPPDLAVIAARIYRHMQDVAHRKVSAGEMLPAVAAAKLRPWAALAIHAGADLPELDREWSEYPARAEWVAVLATTRDHALERHHTSPTEGNENLARDLCALANGLAYDPNGRDPVPLYQPALERRVAA